MGYNPRANWSDKPSPIPQVTKRLEQFKEAQHHAQELMIKAQQSWVKHKDMPKYRVGDQVWLEGKHLHMHQPTHKLVARRHGPFPIEEVLSPITYRLTLPHQWRIHLVFHIDLLTSYQEMPMHGANYQHPPPDLVDGEVEYEVEKVIDSQHFGRRRALQYLVKWKGYPDLENQWVNRRDMNTEEAIREYEELAQSGGRREATKDKRKLQSQGTSSSPIHLRMSSTSSPSSFHSTINSPFVDNTINLTIEEDVSPMVIDLTRSNAASPTVVDLTADDNDAAPITGQELQQVLHCFPLNPEPARLSPDLPGFPAPPGILDAPRGFRPEEDPNGNREYYILHREEGQVCNLQPLSKDEVAGLLAALPDGEGNSPEPRSVRPRLGSPSPVAEGSGGVEAGAAGAGLLEDKREEAAAARATARAYPGDPGPATEDEDVDLFDPQHPFITYSSFHTPDKSTPHACNTDGTPMYQATFRSNPPNILLNAANSSRARG